MKSVGFTFTTKLVFIPLTTRLSPYKLSDIEPFGAIKNDGVDAGNGDENGELIVVNGICEHNGGTP